MERPNYKTISSFRELKDYLLSVRPVASGHKVLKYDVAFVGDEGIVRQKHLMPSGEPAWFFYGYLDDVKHNVALGLLEPTGGTK